jgi:hypothetical protein
MAIIRELRPGQGPDPHRRDDPPKRGPGLAYEPIPTWIATLILMAGAGLWSAFIAVLALWFAGMLAPR